MAVDYVYIRNQEMANQAPRFPNAIDICYWHVWPYSIVQD